MVIGLTGGIASGKSLVADILRELGAEIIDADEVYRSLIVPGAPLYEKILSQWGKEILNDNGHIDRRKLGTMVFSDPEQRHRLDALTHPAIIDSIKEKLEKGEKKISVVVAPLLLEAGQKALVNQVWLVVLDEETQLRRLSGRDNLSGEEARRRIQSQMPQREKEKYADLTIDNSGSKEMTRTQVLRQWQKIYFTA
jgi:dephospho-CoA kinase